MDDEYGSYDDEVEEIKKGAPMLTKRKQKVCVHFQKGKCMYGDKCLNSHEKKQAPQAAPCKFFLTGNCNYGANCKNFHD